ncbi:uncharacterized protein [Coffea arabica]|uniref:Uncharacterized protein n=1 Tax=Coffea arabica TaxID=13443 RepID=A0ABM4V6V6_COFAR
MGCGISVFYHSQQRDATEERHKQRVGDHRCGINIIAKNTVTSASNSSSPPPTTTTLSSPSKLFTLGFPTKSTSSLMHGGGDHQDLRPHPKPNYHPTNKCVLPPPLQHIYNDEATYDDRTLAEGDGGVNLILLHRLGSADEGAVLVPDLKETKSTRDVNHHDAAISPTNHHHLDNDNNSERDELEEVGAKISDYDGPLWIASPSFKEYCIAGSDSDDSSKGGGPAAGGNHGREVIENKMERPKDNVTLTLSDEDSGIIHQASGTRRPKKTRLTVRKVLGMHRPKHAVVKNFFSKSSAWSSSKAKMFLA